MPTVFESLDDADVRTAGTTYLIYRGRHRHEVAGETRAGRGWSTATLFRHAVWGPRELFYADLFASPQDRLPPPARAARARATSTPAAWARYLVEHDLFDFLLFSLPDNDTYSHRHGPEAQVDSIAGGRPPARSG